MKRSLLALAALFTIAVLPAASQARGGGSAKHEFAVSQNRAMSAARAALVNQGFELIRVENVGNDRVVYYRRGNMGNGKGKGPPMKLIIRRVGNRVVFVDTPNAVLADVNVKLSS